MDKKALESIGAILLIGYWAIGQDTIQVSKKYKTILIFPDDVVKSIIGNDLKFNIDAPSLQGKYSGRIVKLYYNGLPKEEGLY